MVLGPGVGLEEAAQVERARKLLAVDRVGRGMTPHGAPWTPVSTWREGTPAETAPVMSVSRLVSDGDRLFGVDEGGALR